MGDPFRGECRNVGVLVDDGSAQTGRFLGQSSPGPGKWMTAAFVGTGVDDQEPDLFTFPLAFKGTSLR